MAGQCNNYGEDIIRYNDLDVINQPEVDNSTGGSNYLLNSTNDALCTRQYALMHDNDFENSGGWRGYNHASRMVGTDVEAVTAHGNAFLIMNDSFMYAASNNAPSLSDAIYANFNLTVLAAFGGMAGVVHPVEKADEQAAAWQARLNAFAFYVVFKDDPVQDSATDHGNTLQSFRDINSGGTVGNTTQFCTQGCLDPIYYVPIGKALAAAGSSIGPCGDNSGGLASCNFGVSSGLWDATDGVWRRHYTHGEAFYCPATTGQTGQVNCAAHAITLDGCEYQLLNSSTNAPMSGTGSALGGYIDQATPQTRQYNASCVTTFTPSNGVGYIFMLSKS